MVPATESDGNESSKINIHERSVVYSPEMDGWEKLIHGDADRFGNIRNYLFETPDGTYVHASRDTNTHVKHDEYGFCNSYSVKQVGDRIRTKMFSGEDREVVLKDECREFLTGYWGGVVGTHWSGKTVSVSLEDRYSGWEDDFDLDELYAAGPNDITFEVTLE